MKTRESKPLNKERLSANRLKIKSASAAQFNHPLSLQKEILRCKPSLDPSQIKLAKLMFNTIIIATDDQETHQLLNEIWPDDAFLLGVIKQPPRDMTEISLIIKGIDESVILDKEVMSQLANQGLQNAQRIVSKISKKPTPLVKVTTTQQSANFVMKNGVFIGFSRYKVEKCKKALQCYRCQKIGHSAPFCKEKQTCVRCGGEHTHVMCNSSALKCANCGGPHAACSRQCPFIAQNHTSKPHKVAVPSYASIVAKEGLNLTRPVIPLNRGIVEKKTSLNPSRTIQPNTATQPSTTQLNIESINDTITKIIEEKLNGLLDHLNKKIQECLSTKLDSLISSTIDTLISSKFEEYLNKKRQSILPNQLHSSQQNLLIHPSTSKELAAKPTKAYATQDSKHPPPHQ